MRSERDRYNRAYACVKLSYKCLGPEASERRVENLAEHFFYLRDKDLLPIVREISMSVKDRKTWAE